MEQRHLSHPCHPADVTAAASSAPAGCQHPQVPWLSQQGCLGAPSVTHRGRKVFPRCRGNACQAIDKQQICVSADAFLMACPEVQTLGLYPPASQPSEQQSLVLKQSEGCHRPCFPALLMHLPLTHAHQKRQIWSLACTEGLWGAWGGAVQGKIKVQVLLCPWHQGTGTHLHQRHGSSQPGLLSTHGSSSGSSALLFPAPALPTPKSFTAWHLGLWGISLKLYQRNEILHLRNICLQGLFKLLSLKSL